MEPKADTTPTFWLVWNECGGIPRYKHSTQLSAREEAKRLARMNPDRKFHVLSLVATCQVERPPVLWAEAEEIEVPF